MAIQLLNNSCGQQFTLSRTVTRGSTTASGPPLLHATMVAVVTGREITADKNVVARLAKAWAVCCLPVASGATAMLFPLQANSISQILSSASTSKRCSVDRAANASGQCASQGWLPVQRGRVRLNRLFGGLARFPPVPRGNRSC